LLESNGFCFSISTTSAEELCAHPEGPIGLVAQNARLKALPVAELHPDCVVIGADTVVAWRGDILGKPADLQEAALMLEKLNGNEHSVHTGVYIIHAKSRREVEFVETTRVRFRNLSLDQRMEYQRRINPLDKAGGYAAQEDNGQLIAETIGSFTNVVGLPMEALCVHLRQFGIVPA
jgi:septum formation protein